MIIFQTPLTLTAEYVMNGADLMLPGVATLSGMAEKYTFNIHNDNDNLQYLVTPTKTFQFLAEIMKY